MQTNCEQCRQRRFFPALYYLSTSKIAIAVTGNFAFAMALCLYHLLTKARTRSCCSCNAMQYPRAPSSTNVFTYQEQCGKFRCAPQLPWIFLC